MGLGFVTNKKAAIKYDKKKKKVLQVDALLILKIKEFFPWGGVNYLLSSLYLRKINGRQVYTK